HGHRALETLTSASVVKIRLTAGRQVGELQHPLDLLLARTVEHRRCHGYAVRQIACQLLEVGVIQAVDLLTLTAGLVVDLLDERAQLRRGGLGFEHPSDLQANALRRPTKVRFQHLADVHTRGHAQRIQYDVYRRTVLGVRHVLHRYDGGNHSLVTVAAGHLVARLHAALHREIDLHHLEHARGKIVA